MFRKLAVACLFRNRHGFLYDTARGFNLRFHQGTSMKGTKPKKPKDTPEKQHARFIEAAKQAEADEAPDAMDKAFKKINPQKRPSAKP